MKLRYLLIPVVATLSLSLMGATNRGAATADMRSDIARRLDVPVKAIRESVIPGVYEVANGGEVIYVSSDGRYAIKGDIYDTDHGRNVTDRRRSEARAV